MALRITIASIFHIPQQGTVLAGDVKEGRVYAGQRIVVVAPSESIDVRISGLEVDKETVSSASAGQSVGLLINDFTPDALGSGIRKREQGGYEIVDLVGRDSERHWWQFWKG